MEKIILVGGGGHGRVLFSALKIMQVSMLGYVDKVETALSSSLPYLGNDQVLKNFSHEILLVNGIGMIRGNSCNFRHKFFITSKNMSRKFYTLIHPTSYVASESILGEGNQVMAGSVIQAFSRIGFNCLINTSAIIEHDCVLGNSVHIAPGAVVCGGVTIGDNVHVGAGAVIIQGISIGDNVTIGAGAVVTSNLSIGTTAVGIPARPI